MKAAKLFVFITLTLAIVSCIAPFALQLPPSIAGSLALSLAMTELHIASAILNFWGLKKFTPQFKRAYGFICIASLLIAAGMLQLMVVGAADLWEVAWVNYGGVDLPFILGVLALYLGILFFAHLIKLESHPARKIVRLIATAGLVSVVGGVIADMVHPALRLPGELAIGYALFQGVVLASTAALALQVKRQAGPLYTPPLAWLFMAFIIASLGTFQQGILPIILAEDNWYLQGRMYMLFNLLSGVASLRAALAFKVLTKPSDSYRYASNLTFFGKPAGVTTKSEPIIDSLTYMTGLVSNVGKVDPVLDELRTITALKTAGEKLTTSEEERLAKVYLALEEYLCNEDPARKYNKRELREMMERQFPVVLTDTTYWRSVSKSS